MKQNVHKKNFNLLKIINVRKEGDLPLACFTNLRSASLHLGSQLSPVQSKEWEDSQSASAHDMLHTCIHNIIRQDYFILYAQKNKVQEQVFY
jgi:hypothetical protein